MDTRIILGLLLLCIVTVSIAVPWGFHRLKMHWARVEQNGEL